MFALLVACTVAVTATCLQVLAMNDLARTAARLASVSSDPTGTAGGYVREHARGVSVTVRTDTATVDVTLERRIGLRVPFVRTVWIGLPVRVSSVMALEPPGPAPVAAN